MLIGLVIVIVAMVLIYSEDKPSANFQVSDYFMAVLMNGTTLVCGAVVGRLLGLTKPEAVSVGYEVSTQNLSIPLFIFANSYSGDERANMTTVLFIFGISSLVLNVMYMSVVVRLGWTNRAKDANGTSRVSWMSTSELTDL